MLVPTVGAILVGIYAVVFSKNISERAQREKWAFGGNRVFVVVVGILMLAAGGFLLQGFVEQLSDSDRPERGAGWRWVWAFLGLIIFSVGMFHAARSRQIAEKSVELRKWAVFPISMPTSRRGWVIAGAIEMLVGAWWIVGSLL